MLTAMKLSRAYRSSILLAVFAAVCLPLAAENWPFFRGPSRQGISSDKNVPLEWDEKTGVRWAQDIPGSGWSSPIVWTDKVFVTITTEEGASCRVIALDAASGRILWNTEVFRQVPESNRRQNSFATPTPATDGRLVYAVFNDGGIAALDYEGQVVWTHRDFHYFSQHGLGNSPILHDDLLIMTYDGSSRAGDKIGWKIPWDGAALRALDTRTGKLRWEGKRGKSRIAHVTPNLMKVNGRMQLVSSAGDVIQGFDPADGRRLWSVFSQGEGVVPSVVVGKNLAYTASGFEASTIRAVRPGGEIVWEQTRAVPHIPSFLYLDPYLYSIHENGIALCMRADSGEIVWQARVGGAYWASPVLAGGRIYFLSEDCLTTVIEPGAEYKAVASNALPGRCKASMAVSDGRFYIRTDTKLFSVTR